jgi:endonuclease YncB( thermonuclease family)
VRRVSKPWKPGRKAVELRPSRIRRDPVRLESNARIERAAAVVSREREIWGGVAGVLLLAVALAVLAIGISVATYSRYDAAAAARDARFGQCYNGGRNCVIDGDTIYVAGERVEIAGIEAPRIQSARCPDERNRGIETAVQLAELLNSGSVAVSPTFSDVYGREVRKVEVDGRDVGLAMIGRDLARRYDGTAQPWC